MKRRIEEKRSKKIIEEKIVEKEAPKRQEIIIEEVPEIKNVTVYVKPQTTYTATCDCGCKCHRTNKSYTHSVRNQVPSNHHSY